jgi:4-hydroxythreonine-4-phosphate dehydrogenase
LAHVSEAKDVLMLMVAGDLRVGCRNRSRSVKRGSGVDHERTHRAKIALIVKPRFAKVDFMITKPRIAVLGLNPHAGDRGTLGNEEQDTIIPVVQKVQRRGRNSSWTLFSRWFFWFL